MNYRYRTDLELFPLEPNAAAGDSMQWAVRDPLDRQCYYLGNEEHFLLTHLDGKTTFAEIQTKFESIFAPRTISFSEFQNLVADWAIKGLLVCDPLELGKLKATLGDSGSPKNTNWLGRHFSNPLVIRFRGWDPQRFLNLLEPATRFLYSRNFLFASALLFLFAIYVALDRLEIIISELAQLPLLFQPQHWLIVVLLIGFTKILHELGHALTCHRYGGRCHEMGVMFLAFIPCLYCNVSDAWTFPRRRQRVAVSAAGILVDLWIAAFCLILWSLTQPGLFHSVCLLLALSGSVNSVLLNGNPLMRYDGYYVISDLLGIPNMRTESQRQARVAFWNFLFGTKTGKIKEPFSLAMATYGVASGIYLWLVIIVILSGLHFMLKPIHLEIFAVLVGILVIPAQLHGTGKQIKREMKNEFQLRGRRKWRATAAGFLLASLFFLGIMTPFPRRIPAIGVIRPVSVQAIVATNPGSIVQAFRPGEKVESGATVLQLQDTQLDQRLLNLQNRIETLKVKTKAIQVKRTQYENSAETLLLLKQVQESFQNEWEQIKQQKSSLNLTATSAGEFIPDPLLYKKQLPANQQSELEKHLRGTSLLDQDYRGAFIPEGTRIGVIAKPATYEVLLAIEEHWARNVETDADVLIFSHEFPNRPLRGTLTKISRTMRQTREDNEKLLAERQILHRYLSGQPGQEDKKYFYAVVTIPRQKPSSQTTCYQLCRVRLRTGNASLWNRFSDFLSRTLIRF